MISFHFFFFTFFATLFLEERWITSVLERKIWNSNDKVIYSAAGDLRHEFSIILFTHGIFV